MITIFGQFPQNAVLLGQFALHATVGGIADEVINEPQAGGGRWVSGEPAYVRRSEVSPTPPKNEEDLVAAITAFMLLERNQSL